jgi:hypothetical protein
VNDHQSPHPFIKDGHTAKFSLKLDKLSICFHDDNAEHVAKTCGLLITPGSWTHAARLVFLSA